MGVFYGAMFRRRLIALLVLAAASAVALAGFALVSFGTAQTSIQHISFVLATGSAGGTYFPVGRAIAEIISHPPGVARCDSTNLCGPPGLVASTRSSLGSVANILDVDSDRADSGLAQSDIVLEALAGKGEFRAAGPQNHVRVIADLYPEQVHLVAARDAHIRTVADLKGKRVALGTKGSGTWSTARAILSAYRVPERRVKESEDAPEAASDRLQHGDLDAFFFVGGAPVEFISDLLSSGKAVFIPIDGAGRARLLADQPGFLAETIPAGAYPDAPASIETVGVRATLIVNDSEPDYLVYAITKALFNPANRSLLEAAHPIASAIRPEIAAKNLPAPLHPGAARFYREIGETVSILAPPRN